MLKKKEKGCPGNPEGHHWLLVKETGDFDARQLMVTGPGLFEGLWLMITHREFVPYESTRPHAWEPVLIGWKRRWACSHCRTVEDTYEEVS